MEFANLEASEIGFRKVMIVNSHFVFGNKRKRRYLASRESKFPALDHRHYTRA